MRFLKPRQGKGSEVILHYFTRLSALALVRQLVYANVMIMDQYLPGIMAVIYGNVSPIEAVAQVES